MATYPRDANLQHWCAMWARTGDQFAGKGARRTDLFAYCLADRRCTVGFVHSNRATPSVYQHLLNAVGVL